MSKYLLDGIELAYEPSRWPRLTLKEKMKLFFKQKTKPKEKPRARYSA
jgi:hypothetical protein